MKPWLRGSIAAIAALFLAIGLVHTVAASETEAPSGVIVPPPVTSKESSRSIRITWSSAQDDIVKAYYVMRRETNDNEGVGEWKTLAEKKSDQEKDGPLNHYTDRLTSSLPQQYEYKICTLSENGAVDTREPEYAKDTDDCAVFGTNIKICIDPGHFGTRNNNYEAKGANKEFPYSEAKFTLKIGKELQKDLKEFYGIDSYMTRTGNTISLTYKGKKYVNKKLDDRNIAIRGYMAKAEDCDFFISLHTNSTGRVKKPWNQPKSINKTYVFVNNEARREKLGMDIANSIGLNVTAYNQEAGIQIAGFQTRARKKAISYKKLSKDPSKKNGTVVFREGSGGMDYYGVLRGASEVGVQGILVEHAFHDTKIVREQASVSKELYQNWAACDAYGIAYGFGLVKKREQQAQVIAGEEAADKRLQQAENP